jgi:hypothetical protein
MGEESTLGDHYIGSARKNSIKTNPFLPPLSPDKRKRTISQLPCKLPQVLVKGPFKDTELGPHVGDRHTIHNTQPMVKTKKIP